MIERILFIYSYYLSIPCLKVFLHYPNFSSYLLSLFLYIYESTSLYIKYFVLIAIFHRRCLDSFLLEEYPLLNIVLTLLWRHIGRDGVSNHQPHDCLLNRLDSGADQRKHQSSTSLAFVQGIHRWPVNSPHKWPVTREIFPIDDVIISMATKSRAGDR